MEGWITSDGNTPANVMCDQIIVVEKLQAKPGKDAVNIDYVNTVVKGGSIGLERQSVKVRNLRQFTAVSTVILAGTSHDKVAVDAREYREFARGVEVESVVLGSVAIIVYTSRVCIGKGAAVPLFEESTATVLLNLTLRGLFSSISFSSTGIVTQC